MRNASLFSLTCLALACSGETITKTNEITNTITNTNTNTNTVTLPGGTVVQNADCDYEGDVPTVCRLSGTLLADSHLTPEVDWVLVGGVFVGNDQDEVTLTIDAGTVIYGDQATKGMLVVTRGSKLVADGTATDPIVFTSAQPVGSRARGDWGGIVLNGRAPINNCESSGVCEAFGEGGTGFYGGEDANDDSGSLQYVRVEYAGILISPDNEVNGIAFQGVGAGTTVDHVQIHMPSDDGMEFFGGTVDVRHVLITGGADDNLDWTFGYRGRIQYFIGQQFADAGDNGIEADNNEFDFEAGPRSQPILSNVTLIGSPDSASSDLGALLRRGTAGELYSTILTDWNDACLALSQASTTAQADAGALAMTASIAHCATNFRSDDDEVEVTDAEVADFFTADPTNLVVDAGEALLGDPTNESAPDYAPVAGSAAASGGTTPADPWFDPVTFRGAMDAGDDWTAGWTTHDAN